MAVDTKDKRASAIKHGLMYRTFAPTPDGSLTSALDRVHMGGLYRLAATALVSVFAPGVKFDKGSGPAWRDRWSGLSRWNRW